MRFAVFLEKLYTKTPIANQLMHTANFTTNNTQLNQKAQRMLERARRIVVKVGSSLVTNKGRGLDIQAIDSWCKQLAVLHQKNSELIMVSSGAVAEGMLRLGWHQRPQEIHELQAAAAVGQMGLAQMYESKLSACGLQSAQILLTHADLADRERYLNARSTLSTLLRLGVVPIINENDTVVNDEIKFGDNDTLAALVANLIEADVLIILTDQHGLFTADPRQDTQAQCVRVAQADDIRLQAMAGGAGSNLGKGGMTTKVLAAKRAARSGASTVIAWGREPDVLPRLLQGECLGTVLIASTHKMQARKQWIANHLQVRGSVVVDAGAAEKIQVAGKSLLPIGMVQVMGEFSRGEVISVYHENSAEIARGLANYTSSEAQLLCKKPSSEFKRILGYAAEPEMIHRDNMVLLN